MSEDEERLINSDGRKGLAGVQIPADATVTSGNASFSSTGSGRTDEVVDRSRSDRSEFGSDYEVVEFLGKGGMSLIYKVRHKLLDKTFAVKMLQRHLLLDRVQVERFKIEAQALCALEHPNIVGFRGFGETEDGKLYMIMDFLDGKSLSDLLKDGDKIPVTRALDIFIQACEALQHAHGKNIIHRDIKPSNIIVNRAENGHDVVKLVDFGIAKLQQPDVASGLTETGDVFGSPPYMSPEQCLGQKLDARSDIYSFGCVMYEVLSGQPPFISENALGVIHMHTGEMPPPLVVPDCDPRLPHALDEIVFKTLEKDPNLRYQKIEDLQKELVDLKESTGFRNSTGVYLKYTRAQRHFSRALRRHPFRLATVSVALLATLMAGIVGWTYLTPVAAKLSAQPETTISSLKWNWPAREIKADPVDFGSRVNAARMILERYGLATGLQSAEVINHKATLAAYLVDHGHFDLALEFLPSIARYYELQERAQHYRDSHLPDAEAMWADCLIATGGDRSYNEAVRLYRDAVGNYNEVQGPVINDGALKTLLKLARTELTVGDIEHARRHFYAALTTDQIRGENKGLAQSSIGDCLLLEAMNEGNSAKLLSASLLYYEKAHDTFVEQGDLDNAATTMFRIADIQNVQQKYAKGLKVYDLLRRDLRKNWEKSLGVPAVKLTYARVLWHTGDKLQALRTQYE